jgi:hypothetical protein
VRVSRPVTRIDMQDLFRPSIPGFVDHLLKPPSGYQIRLFGDRLRGRDNFPS